MAVAVTVLFFARYRSAVCRGKFALLDSDSSIKKVCWLRGMLRREPYGVLCTIKCVYKLLEFLSMFPNDKYAANISEVYCEL